MWEVFAWSSFKSVTLSNAVLYKIVTRQDFIMGSETNTKKKKASKQVLSQVQLEISMQYILAAADYCWKADTVQDAAVTTSPSPAPDNKTI